MKHELHIDAPPVPEGMRPKPGVEYGCGKPDCDQCYEPDPDAAPETSEENS